MHPGILVFVGTFMHIIHSPAPHPEHTNLPISQKCPHLGSKMSILMLSMYQIKEWKNNDFLKKCHSCSLCRIGAQDASGWCRSGTSAGSQNTEAEVSTFLEEEVRGMLRGSGELIRQNKWWQPEGIHPITIRLEGMSRGDKPTRYSVRKV